MDRTDLEILKNTRAETLRRTDALTQAQLDFAPAADKWSVGEILDHLILAQGVYRRDIEELIRLARAGCPAHIRRTFADVDVSVAFIPKQMLPFLELPFGIANLVIPSQVRDLMARSRIIPVQNPSIATPRKGRPGRELRLELGESLDKTVAAVEGNADLDYSQMTVYHPLLGENNLCQILRLIASHESRHQQQMQEVVCTPGFPCA